MPRGTEVGSAQAKLCSMGTMHLQQRGHNSPQMTIFGHIYCGQTTSWIKMALGTEVCLRPGHIVLGVQLSPKGAHQQSPKLFCPYLLRPNGWITECIKMALGTEEASA